MSGGVTARVAFLFGFGAVFFLLFFILCFGGFVFSTEGRGPTAEAATIPPRAAKGAAKRQGETQAKRTVVQETKEVGDHSVATRLAFWFRLWFFFAVFSAPFFL